MDKPIFTVRLASPQLEWLRLEAERLGLSVAELLRRIIDRYRGEQIS